MDKTEILTNLGVVIGAFFAALFTYAKTRKPSPPLITADAVVTGVGVELGNRMQTDQLITQVTRIADSLEVLADRKREETEEKLDKILERLTQRERAAARRRSTD